MKKEIIKLFIFFLVMTMFCGAVNATNAHDITLVTNGANGTGGNGDGSNLGSMSSDGNIIVFQSYSTDIIQNKTTTVGNIFVYNRLTNQTTLITKGSNNNGGNSESYSPIISADGKMIAFNSFATNLIPDLNLIHSNPKAYVYNMTSGTTTLITKGPYGTGLEGIPHSLSPDGEIITFFAGPELLPDVVTSGWCQLYYYNMTSGTTTLVSKGKNGTGANHISGSSDISADKKMIVFTSYASDIIPNTTTRQSKSDIFIYDITTGITSLITKGISGKGGNKSSWWPSISEDGSIVVFTSIATDLIPGVITNNYQQIFLYNVSSGQYSLITKGSNGAGGNGDANYCSISADGKILVFSSFATNLIKGIITTSSNLFSYNLTSGITTLITKGPKGKGGNGTTHGSAISADGKIIALSSEATDLINGFKPNNNNFQVYFTKLNSNPCAINDYITTFKNSQVNIYPLANDYDIDGDELSFKINENPIHGGILIYSNNVVSYMPNYGYVGSDSFTYTIFDGYGGIMIATVMINIINPDLICPTAYVNVKSGLYNTNKVVSLTMSELGNIYYTINGATPTKYSTKYTGPLTITSSTTLKFMAIDDAGNPSPVYTATYKIDKTAPKVISTYPKRYATKISRTSAMYIKFSEKLKGSVNWSKIVVKNKYGKAVSIRKWIYNNVLYIKTRTKRSRYSYYTIYIPYSAIKDYAGNHFAARYTIKFKTGR